MTAFSQTPGAAMKRHHSLTRHLTVALVLTQWAAFMIAVAIIVVMNNSGMLRRTMGSGLTGEYVADAVENAKDGSLRLRADDCLEAYLARHPDAWYVVTDGKQVLSGGGENEPARAHTARIAETVAAFQTLTADDAPSADLVNNNGTRLMVATGGASIDWADSGMVLVVVLRNLVLPLTVPLVLGAVIVLLFVSRRLLRSVSRAARAAEDIAPNVRGQRLPLDGIPVELLPLVKAVNTALATLDDGYDRYRRFVADAAHEMRTPVAVFQARLDAMAEGPLKDELARDARRIANIATRLLEMERVQQAAFVEEPVDLAALARAVAAETAPLALERGYDVEVAAPDDGPCVLGDAAALRGALTNLVANAIAHGGNRGLIRIVVSEEGMVTVGDEGPGVPADQAEAIFDAFRRLNPAGGGAGLGLAIVRETMRVHGGTAQLINPGAPGALFRLSFPPQRILAG
jgi:signal transduction histidine kinase